MRTYHPPWHVLAHTMSIPSAYQLALEAFDLDDDTSCMRREVWEILAPRMDNAVRRYFERSNRIAPYYREILHKNPDRHREIIVTYTGRLFQNQFDAQWVADCKARADAEASLGLDMRGRGVIAQCILAEFHDAVTRRHRYSSRTASRLLDTAERVLLLDMANASVVHHHAEVRKAKAQANQLDAAIVNFAETIENVRDAVLSAVELLGQSSSRLTTIAGNAASYAAAGTKAADMVASQVGNMAASAEELAASIKEVRRQAVFSVASADEAASGADHVSHTVELLSEAVTKIGSVVDLIAKIAAQTNLLALNATIEAARAGDKGKGFAVVASEVKSLAAQTSHATKDIGQQIAVIEDTTRRSVEEIAEMTRKIVDVAGASRSLEIAVTEQTAATGTIAEGANNAARNAIDAAESLKTCASEVKSTQDTAKSVLDAATELSNGMREMDVAMNALIQASSQQLGMKKLIDLKKDAAA